MARCDQNTRRRNKDERRSERPLEAKSSSGLSLLVAILMTSLLISNRCCQRKKRAIALAAVQNVRRQISVHLAFKRKTELRSIQIGAHFTKTGTYSTKIRVHSSLNRHGRVNTTLLRGN